MSKQIINKPLCLEKVAKGRLTDSCLLVRSKDNIIKEIDVKDLKDLNSSKQWMWHIPLTSCPSSLFFTNIKSAGSYPVNSNSIGVNYFQLMSDSPYNTDLNINAFESAVNLFIGDSLSVELVYDTSVNDLPEFFNTTCWRVAIGQTGVETDFTGLDFSLRGNFEIASKRNTDITRIDTGILFAKDLIYNVQITRSAQGYNVKISDKKTSEVLFESELTTNVSELSGFTVFPYNKTGSSPSGLFKMGIVRLGYCPSK
ncbi:hypothetical protein BWK63_11950 [Flavobacterium covae]|nr:hypothetical protein [Flavobacterium covae]OWP80247.1 hypothetical protein BWK63_11950 [Flavobacterium covae]